MQNHKSPSSTSASSEKDRNPLFLEIAIVLGEVKASTRRHQKAFKYVEDWMKKNEPWALGSLYTSQREYWRFEE